MSSDIRRQEIAVLRHLREVREAKGMTQTELAEKVGVGTALVSHLETGRRAASLETALALADALQVSLDYLLGRRSTKAVSDPLAAKLLKLTEQLTEAEVQFLLRTGEDLVRLRDRGT